MMYLAPVTIKQCNATYMKYSDLTIEQQENINDMANLSKLVDDIISMHSKTKITIKDLCETLSFMAERRNEYNNKQNKN